MQVKAEWLSDTQGIMGTEVSVTLWSDEPKLGEKAIAAVMTEMQRINDTYSPYIETSALSQLNQRAYAQTQTLDAEFSLLIDKSLWYSHISQGAFNITFSSLARFYDYRKGKAPTALERQKAMPALDYSLLDFNKSARTLRYKHKALNVDLGGIAKGYAVDRAMTILKAHGIEHASVSAGGDSRLLGDRRGRPWVIGIKNPRNADNEAVIRLPLVDIALSTSGDYERFFIDEQSGERVHHIMNPATGHSANAVMSVTVMGEQGLDTDPLSTTLFVLGVDAGLALVNKIPNYDAIIIDIHGKVHYSNGLIAGADNN